MQAEETTVARIGHDVVVWSRDENRGRTIVEADVLVDVTQKIEACWKDLGMLVCFIT